MKLRSNNDFQNIKELINNTKRTNLDIQAQLFIKYLRTSFDKYSELYNQIRLEFIKKELNITELTRLNVDNNIKYISIVSNDEIEIIKKNGSEKNE